MFTLQGNMHCAYSRLLANPRIETHLYPPVYPPHTYIHTHIHTNDYDTKEELAEQKRRADKLERRKQEEVAKQLDAQTQAKKEALARDAAKLSMSRTTLSRLPIAPYVRGAAFITAIDRSMPLLRAQADMLEHRHLPSHGKLEARIKRLETQREAAVRLAGRPGDRRLAWGF
jgi:hypothetical protein